MGEAIGALQESSFSIIRSTTEYGVGVNKRLEAIEERLVKMDAAMKSIGGGISGQRISPEAQVWWDEHLNHHQAEGANDFITQYVNDLSGSNTGLPKCGLCGEQMPPPEPEKPSYAPDFIQSLRDARNRLFVSVNPPTEQGHADLSLLRDAIESLDWRAHAVIQAARAVMESGSEHDHERFREAVAAYDVAVEDGTLGGGVYIPDKVVERYREAGMPIPGSICMRRGRHQWNEKTDRCDDCETRCLVVPRPEIAAFAIAMEAKMATHDHDRGDSWKDKDRLFFQRRIGQELVEYADATFPEGKAVEAIDIGCFAMMAWWAAADFASVAEAERRHEDASDATREESG